MGNFTTIFAPKLMTLAFNLLHENAIKIQKDYCADRSILALLSAYQECPVTFKLMTSQVVERARSLTGHIWPVGSQRVNSDSS